MANLSIFFLIPAHNAVKYPQYWYEFMMQMTVGMWPNWAASILLQSVFWGNFPSLKTWGSYAYLYCYVACVNFVLTCSYYVLWTQYYGYYSPMPFTGYTAGLISGTSAYLALWFRYYPGSWI